MILRTILTLATLTAVVLFFPGMGHSQEPKKDNFTVVSPDQLKKILDELKLPYQKKQGAFSIKLSKPGDKNVQYEVIVESFNGGRALVVGTTFAAMEVAEEDAKGAARLLQKVNDWNAESALSRGMRRELMNAKGKQVFVPRLEADLDCSMGITKQDVNRLIQRFPAALKDFENFVK